MKPRRANVLVLTLLFIGAFALFSKLVFDVGRWVVVEQRLQAAADAALLSSLRVRVEGLQAIAERWRSGVGRFVVEGYPNGEMLVPSAAWVPVTQNAESLRRAIGGYKGRVTACLGVVLDANRASRDAGGFLLNDAQELGVVAQPARLRDESGHLKQMAGGWYRRLWSPTTLRAQLRERSIYELNASGPPALSQSPRVVSEGHVIWDVLLDDPEVQARGNGGFPAQWTNALEGHRVDPHRFPVFGARLR